MTTLEYLVALDTVREIVSAMTPRQLIVAALRADGMTDGEIGELLGISRAAVNHRMIVARRRIAERVPEARGMLLGRSRLPVRMRKSSMFNEAEPHN